MFGLGATELFIILAIALVIFGGSKLRNLGGDVGGAISEFKKSVSGEDEEKNDEAEAKKKTDEVTSTASTSATPAPDEKQAEPAEQSH